MIAIHVYVIIQLNGVTSRVEGGDLLGAISQQRRLDADHAKVIFYQTCLAVEVLIHLIFYELEILMFM